MADKSTVMIVDDHPLLIKGLKQLMELEGDFEIIAEINNGTDAVPLAIEKQPELIILDLNMEGMNGIETLRRMRENAVASRIVMLTVSDHNEDVIDAITNGANGYLLKDTDPEELMGQIRKAMTGKTVISENITEILATAIRQPRKRDHADLASLTNREYEILSLIAKGMSNKVIARELNISDGTVKVHVKHLLKKLNLRSRVEAAVWMVNQQGAS